MWFLSMLKKMHTIFFITPCISPRHQYQPSGFRPSCWSLCIGLIQGIQWKKVICYRLYESFCPLWRDDPFCRHHAKGLKNSNIFCSYTYLKLLEKLIATPIDDVIVFFLIIKSRGEWIFLKLYQYFIISYKKRTKDLLVSRNKSVSSYWYCFLNFYAREL